MVSSWFRLFDARWLDFEARLGSGVSPEEIRDQADAAAKLAARASAVFDDITISEDKAAGFDEWLNEFGMIPGVLVVIRGGVKSKDQRGYVDVIHHFEGWKSDEDEEENEEQRHRIMGLSSMAGSAWAVALDTSDFFDELIPEKKRSVSSVKDGFVPTLKGLMVEKHSVKEAFKPQAGEAVERTEDLAGRPRGMYLPYPVWRLLWAYLAETGKADEFEVDGPQHPKVLIDYLVAAMNRKRLQEDNDFYKTWKDTAQALLDVLWVACNDFCPGTVVRDVGGSWDGIHFQRECYDAFVAFYNELGEGKKKRGSPGSPSTRASDKEEQGSDNEGLSAQDVPAQAEARRNTPQKRGDMHYERENEEDNAPSERGGNSGRSTRQRLPPEPRGVPRPNQPVPTVMAPDTVRLGETPDWLSEFIKNMNSFAKASTSQMSKKEESKKLTGTWLSSGVYIFRVLSSEDGWNTEGLPELTGFAKELISKNIMAATKNVRETYREENWNGCMFKTGIADFLKRGFIADDVNVAPQGFSALFFYPSSYVERDSAEMG